jgi:hypothetical protein
VTNNTLYVTWRFITLFTRVLHNPAPSQLNPTHNLTTPSDTLQCESHIYSFVSHMVPFTQGFRIKLCLLFPHKYFHLTYPDLKTSKCLVRTNHVAPHYTIFNIFQFFSLSLSLSLSSTNSPHHSVFKHPRSTRLNTPVATVHWANRGIMVIFPVGIRDVLFSEVLTQFVRLWGPTGPSFKRQGVLFPGVMRPGRKVPPPSSIKFKNACSYTSTPPRTLHSQLMSPPTSGADTTMQNVSNFVRLEVHQQW